MKKVEVFRNRQHSLNDGNCKTCILNDICLPLINCIYPAHIVSRFTLSRYLFRAEYVLNNFPSVVDFVKAGIKL